MAGLDAAILVLEQPTHIIDNYAIVTEVVVRMGDLLQYLKTPFPDLIRLQHIAIGGDCPATFVDDFVGRLTTGGVSKKLLHGWTVPPMAPSSGNTSGRSSARRAARRSSSERKVVASNSGSDGKSHASMPRTSVANNLSCALMTLALCREPACSRVPGGVKGVD